MPKRKKSNHDKAMDGLTEQAFYFACSGIPVPVLKLSEIYVEGRRLQMAGASHTELCAGVKAKALQLSQDGAS